MGSGGGFLLLILQLTPLRICDFVVVAHIDSFLHCLVCSLYIQYYIHRDGLNQS